MNMFVKAREENVAAGTMTPGKVDTGRPATQPAPSPSVQAALAASFDCLHRFDISYKIGSQLIEKTFNVQATDAVLSGFVAFLTELGVEFSVAPILIKDINLVRAGLEFAVPPQTVRKKGTNGKRKARRVEAGAKAKGEGSGTTGGPGTQPPRSAPRRKATANRPPDRSGLESKKSDS